MYSPAGGEGDQIEVPKGDRKSGSTTWHYQDSAGAHKQSARSYPKSGNWPEFPGIDFSEWHIFREEWLVDRRTYYIDGIRAFEITGDKLEHSPKMHEAFQGECGDGSFWVTPWDSTTPSQVLFEFDWLRLGVLA